MSATLAAAFGALGTLLAAIGLYGVIASWVTRVPAARKWTGIRVAIGAHPAQVLGMVMRQGFGAGHGIGVVIGGAAGGRRPRSRLSGLLYGITPDGPGGLARGDAALLLAAAAIANVVPGPPRDAGGRVDGAQDGVTRARYISEGEFVSATRPAGRPRCLARHETRPRAH